MNGCQILCYKVAVMRLRLDIEYDGTDFCGWQRQENGPTVQAAIEAALSEMIGVPIGIRGAGRTDAGVHALGQVAHFDSDTDIPLRGLRLGINGALPASISIRRVTRVDEHFDARRSAISKLYRYQIWNGESRAPMFDRFTWQMRRQLDVVTMRNAAQVFIGRHDFSAFRAADCERPTAVRTLRRLDVLRQGNLVIFEVEADAFLKNMVRILCGTLVEVGCGKFSPSEVERILLSRNRSQAGQTAPACGLSLVHVNY